MLAWGGGLGSLWPHSVVVHLRFFELVIQISIVKMTLKTPPSICVWTKHLEILHKQHHCLVWSDGEQSFIHTLLISGSVYISCWEFLQVMMAISEVLAKLRSFLHIWSVLKLSQIWASKRGEKTLPFPNLVKPVFLFLFFCVIVWMAHPFIFSLFDFVTQPHRHT